MSLRKDCTGEARYSGRFLVITVVFVTCLITANIIAVKLVDILGFILPAAVFTEQEGTITNFQGRIQHFPVVVPPLGESKTMLEILARLADSFELPPAPADPQAVYEQLRDEVGHFAKKTYAELIAESAPMKKKP